MNADHDEQPRSLNCAALRTLHALQMKLRMQINDLMAIECEDMEAASTSSRVQTSGWASLTTPFCTRASSIAGRQSYPRDRRCVEAAGVGIGNISSRSC